MRSPPGSRLLLLLLPVNRSELTRDRFNVVGGSLPGRYAENAA
jgi:hypothetical protein